MPRWWSTRRFDALEVLLVVVLVAVLASALTAQRYAGLRYVEYSAAAEGERLRERYGPGHYSRNEEEWVVRDYFQDKRGGTFVDVGANHYKIDSNTFYLESVLGWSGVAIDPQAQFADEYRTYRPGTRFFSFFVSDVSDANATLHEAEGNPLVASENRDFAARAGTEAPKPVYSTRAVTVPTVRLTDLLNRVGMERFDFLSVDVELAEPKVLAGFDIDRFKPALVCIEGHRQVRQQILEYFARHGYVLLGRYLRADLQNLYFAPIGDPQTDR